MAQNFAFVDPITLRDEGRVVRTKAQRVADLVLDEGLLHAERAKVAASAGRFSAAGSASAVWPGESELAQQQQFHQAFSGQQSPPPAQGFGGQADAFGDSAFNPRADYSNNTSGFGVPTAFGVHPALGAGELPAAATAAPAAGFHPETPLGVNYNSAFGASPAAPVSAQMPADPFGQSAFGATTAQPSQTATGLKRGAGSDSAGNVSMHSAQSSDGVAVAFESGAGVGDPFFSTSAEPDPFAMPVRRRAMPKVEIKPLGPPSARTPRKPADPMAALAPPPPPRVATAADPFAPRSTLSPPAAAVPAVADFFAAASVPVDAVAPATIGQSASLSPAAALVGLQVPQPEAQPHDPFGAISLNAPVNIEAGPAAFGARDAAGRINSSKDLLKKHIGLDDAAANLVRLDLGTTSDGLTRSPEKSSMGVGMTAQRAMKPGIAPGQRHLLATNQAAPDPLAAFGQASAPDPRPFGPVSPANSLSPPVLGQQQPVQSVPAKPAAGGGTNPFGAGSLL